MSDEKFDAAAFKKYREQTWIYQRDLTVEEAAQWGYDQLRAERDKWRDEYQNLCKFATDYEDKCVRLEAMLQKIVDKVPCQMLEATWANCSPIQYWDYCCVCEARAALEKK
jgi:hypothetical protein